MRAQLLIDIIGQKTASGIGDASLEYEIKPPKGPLAVESALNKTEYFGPAPIPFAHFMLVGKITNHQENGGDQAQYSEGFFRYGNYQFSLQRNRSGYQFGAIRIPVRISRQRQDQTSPNAVSACWAMTYISHMPLRLAETSSSSTTLPSTKLQRAIEKLIHLQKRHLS